MSDFEKQSGLKPGDRVYTAMVNDQTGEEKRRYGTVKSVDPIMVLEMVDVNFDDSPTITNPIQVELLFKEGVEYKPHISDYTTSAPAPEHGYDICPKCGRVGRFWPGDTRYIHKYEGIMFGRAIDFCDVPAAEEQA